MTLLPFWWVAVAAMWLHATWLWMGEDRSRAPLELPPPPPRVHKSSEGDNEECVAFYWWGGLWSPWNRFEFGPPAATLQHKIRTVSPHNFIPSVWIDLNILLVWDMMFVDMRLEIRSQINSNIYWYSTRNTSDAAAAAAADGPGFTLDSARKGRVGLISWYLASCWW